MFFLQLKIMFGWRMNERKKCTWRSNAVSWLSVSQISYWERADEVQRRGAIRVAASDLIFLLRFRCGDYLPWASEWGPRLRAERGVKRLLNQLSQAGVSGAQFLLFLILESIMLSILGAIKPSLLSFNERQASGNFCWKVLKVFPKLLHYFYEQNGNTWLFYGSLVHYSWLDLKLDKDMKGSTLQLPSF